VHSRAQDYLQSSQHVAGANTVDSDILGSPLDGEGRSEVSHGSLGGVVGGLRLRHIDDSARHGADHDDVAWGVALHQMLGYARGEQVGAVDVDAPELLHALERVVDCVEVLGKACRGDQVVDPAMLGYYLGQSRAHRVWVGDVGVVGGDFGHSKELELATCDREGLN